MPSCTDCGGTVIEYDSAAGNGFCVNCGTVIEESTIVNEISFGETSAGAAMVQGAFVAQGATHARITGPYGNRGNGESREQTISNANKKIQSIANILRLSEAVCLAATRMYTLAVEHKFTKGRKSLNVVAVCLYVACRQKETRNYMLIDFSDLLQVNVFELGHTYLQLVQTLNLRLPLVDPSHYISRFSALLEFGDETSKVATDAVRLVQRFDRDWMTRGRRPAGICGAALLLAARMNNFRRSIEEIVQVVKIADVTLKKRLEEFKASPSGQLTMADFRSVWLEEECDPPAFVKNREQDRAAAEGEDMEEEEEEGWDSDKEREMKLKLKKKIKKGEKKRKGKRKRSILDDGEGGSGAEDGKENTISLKAPTPELDTRKPIDPTLLHEGIFSDDESQSSSPTLGPPSADTQDPYLSMTLVTDPDSSPLDLNPAHHDSVSTMVAEEVSTFLENPQGSQLAEVLDEAERRRLEAINESVVDELQGLDEEELDRFILNDDEVRIKERVWVEMNLDYLEAIAAKGQDTSTPKERKRRKTADKPRDASTPHGSSTADSVRKLLKKNPKYSKRINYDALKDLFVDGVSTSYGDEKDEKDDDDYMPLYTMDDKSDGEGIGGMLIIEEGTSDVAAKPLQDQDGDDDGDGDEGGGGWDDAYEQEV